MPVIQPTLEISKAALEGLATGKYRRIGGVIRDQQGCLVELLKDSSSRNSGENAIQNAADIALGNTGFEDLLDMIREHQGIALGVSIGLAAAVCGLAYFGVKRSRKKRELPDCIKEYFNAVENGNMNAEIIDNVLDYLKGVKGPKILLTTDQFALIMRLVKEYSDKLAKNNEVDFSDLNDGKIIPFLERQRELFKTA